METIIQAWSVLWVTQSRKRFHLLGSSQWRCVLYGSKSIINLNASLYCVRNVMLVSELRNKQIMMNGKRPLLHSKVCFDLLSIRWQCDLASFSRLWDKSLLSPFIPSVTAHSCWKSRNELQNTGAETSFLCYSIQTMFSTHCVLSNFFVLNLALTRSLGHINCCFWWMANGAPHSPTLGPDWLLTPVVFLSSH